MVIGEAAVREHAAGTAGRSNGEFVDRVRRELEPELQVVRPLGRSPVAEVFLAREPSLKRLVAVKVLAPTLASDDKAIRRFAREAQSAARIAHPNVISVYRVGHLGDGLPYLVMRYVKGRSLAALLKAEGPCDGSRACRVLGDIASAVAAGHRRQVVHRDIKPANVLVESATGHIFVVDFGIAAILASGDEEPDRITTVGHLIGDPQYMSPERLLGEPATERSDVYNLGLLGYELLAGRGPFEADSNRGWTEAHISAEPPRLAALRPGIDERLDSLMARCLAKHPDHRPDAADVEETVRSVCAPVAGPATATATATAAPMPAAGPGRVSARTAPAAPAPPSKPKPRPPRGLLAPDGHAYRFEVLGGLDLVASEGGRVLSIVAQPKRVALLSYLVAGAEGPFKRRDRIASVFWPDLQDDRARHALRQAVYVLRGSLGAETIVSRGDDEVSVDADVLWADVVAFERALAADRPDVAMELYRGPLLPGFYLTDSIEFERWLDNERIRLDRLANEASWRLAADHEGEGDWAGALHWGRRALELAPFEESALRRLLELHLRAGDRSGALSAYETFARRLREELEAEPTEETLALVARLRA